MLKIRIESDQLKAELEKVKSRVRNLSAFHRQVTRPFFSDNSGSPITGQGSVSEQVGSWLL